jgi:hypothetical protein
MNTERTNQPAARAHRVTWFDGDRPVQGTTYVKPAVDTRTVRAVRPRGRS